MANDENPIDERASGDNSAAGTPVITLCALTDAQRAAAAGSLLVDLDDGVQLTFDVLSDRGVIRRRTHDLTAILSDTLIPMEHGCIGCSLREVVQRSLHEWSAGGRPVVLALPPTTEPGTVLAELDIGAVVAVIDPTSLEADLFGDDLLDERGIAQGAADRRSVGEVVAHQIEYADVIAYPAGLSTRQMTILDHLSRASRIELHQLSADDLLGQRPGGHRSQDEQVSAGDSCGRSTVADIRPTGASDANGVWTIELRSDRPLSPERLRQELPALGAGPLRGRGYFWLPTRPELRCLWDGAGGQLSIGPAGSWGGCRQTILLITGAGGDPAAVSAAFERALLTDAEYVRGAEEWARVDDGMDPWLGVRTGN